MPKKRHFIRLRLGRMFYSCKRYLLWVFGGLKFAAGRSDSGGFTCEYFSHQTPLLRKLKGADMYLQHNKITNLRIAVSRINGVTVHPGETFSFWKLVGKPTKAKGYLNGMVLKNGTPVAGIGGGLCQLSNLIYWMTLHTPLTVTERHRHGFDVFPDSDRTQPFGSGATCFYNYGDLMIKNNTNQPFKLRLDVGENNLTGAWAALTPPVYRYEVYEKDHVIQSYRGRYTRHNRIFRKIYNEDNKLTADEFVAENHAVMMYEPLLPTKA